MTEIGQWQALPNQTIPQVRPGDFVCPSCLSVCSRPPCVICECDPSDVLEEGHYLVSGYSASRGQSGPTDKTLAAPPAEPPPLLTSPQSAAPEQPHRCSILSSVSEPPSSRPSPAYHSAAEDPSEADGTPEPSVEFTTLDQTQAECVGIPDRNARFYAVAVAPNPRILYGTWESVSPLIAIAAPRADGGPPYRWSP